MQHSHVRRSGWMAVIDAVEGIGLVGTRWFALNIPNFDVKSWSHVEVLYKQGCLDLRNDHAPNNICTTIFEN